VPPILSIVKAIIFDLDGTLYDQKKLRRFMVLNMVRYILTNPAGVMDLKILSDFRKAREKNAHFLCGNIEIMQFEWGANKSRVSVEKVRKIVKDWMFIRPLQYLSACCYPEVTDLFALLKKKNIRTAIFSEYPALEKLNALNLKPDIIVCSTEADIDRLKPDPKGLFVAASKLGVPIEQCLFIGDRDDKDGECARRAGMPYLIMNRRRNDSNGFKSFSEIVESLKMCGN